MCFPTFFLVSKYVDIVAPFLTNQICCWEPPFTMSVVSNLYWRTPGTRETRMVKSMMEPTLFCFTTLAWQKRARKSILQGFLDTRHIVFCFWPWQGAARNHVISSFLSGVNFCGSLSHLFWRIKFVAEKHNLFRTFQVSFNVVLTHCAVILRF